jgi:hypothetical protein
MKVVAVEDVVAEDERRALVAEEVGADDEGLGEAVRAGLDGVLQVDAPLAAVSRATVRSAGCPGGGDDQDVPDAGQQQRAQRVVDHWLVVDRQQLLGDGQGSRVQPGAGAAGEDDAFALGHEDFSPGLRLACVRRRFSSRAVSGRKRKEGCRFRLFKRLSH